MSLLSRFFHRRPPDGLLEFIDRVYVFDSCFTTEVLPESVYQLYLHEIIMELHEEFPDSSFLAFNFREGEKRSQFAEIMCEYDVTVMDYPRQYEGCPLLPLSLVHHFLRVCESWLSLGTHQNVILLHCERGGWPILAFLLASFLIFRKLSSGEKKSLEIVYREAPKGLLQLLSPLMAGNLAVSPLVVSRSPRIGDLGLVFGSGVRLPVSSPGMSVGEVSVGGEEVCEIRNGRRSDEGDEGGVKSEKKMKRDRVRKS